MITPGNIDLERLEAIRKGVEELWLHAPRRRSWWQRLGTRMWALFNFRFITMFAPMKERPNRTRWQRFKRWVSMYRNGGTLPTDEMPDCLTPDEQHEQEVLVAVRKGVAEHMRGCSWPE